MRVLLALLLGLLIAGPAVAQTEKPLTTADISGTWQDEWTSARGFLYSAVLNLRVSPDGLATGSFTWTLKRSPRPEEQAKLGLGATEHVSGRTNTTARTVTLAGTRKDDPHTIIGLDRYKMVVSDDGRVMGGITWNHSDWLGQIILRREALTQ